jgi:CDP-4-dehydro-6-deoxyglucose reductase
VTVVGPYGDFLLDEAQQRPLVLVAEDTGFAPIKSLLEHAVSLEWSAPMHLIWIADSGGHYLGNYMRSLVDALDNLQFTALARDWQMLAAVVKAAASGADIYAAVAAPTFALLQSIASAVGGARLFRYA